MDFRKNKSLWKRKAILCMEMFKISSEEMFKLVLGTLRLDARSQPPDW